MAKPQLDASNIHVALTTKWEGKTYQPYSVRSVESYTIETNMDEDSDPFNLVIGDPYGEYAEILGRDNEVRVQIFGIGEGIQYLMTGLADSCVYSDNGTHIISGRDLSCIATDTLVKPISYRHQRASDIITARARALKCAPRINLMPTNKLGKIATDGSETEWEFWYRFIRRAGQWLWYEPDGTLMSGKLNYNSEPKYFFGTSDGNGSNWIPVETGEFHSSKQQRIGEAVLYYHNNNRLLPVSLPDDSISQWLRKPIKLFEQKDIVKRQAAIHFVKEEIFESQIGVQEIKLVIPDPGVVIRQNNMARLNVPELQLGGEWFIVGTRIIADQSGFTQEVRLREKGFAMTKRVPKDPPTSQEPGKDATDSLKDALQIPNHPAWSEFFIAAAKEFHGNKEFEFFLAVLLGICDQETGFTNERNWSTNPPGVHRIEWFEWDKTVEGPQNGIKDLAEWRLSFANVPGPWGISENLAVGPMQLWSLFLKVEADQVFNADKTISDLYGDRWSPQSNIWIAAKYLHDLCVTSSGGDSTDNESIWTPVGRYGEGPAYANSVRKRVMAEDGWYAIVKTSFEEARATAKAGEQPAVEAVQGTVKQLANEIIDAYNMHPSRYRDDHNQGAYGGDLWQIQQMAKGQRVPSPSCSNAGNVIISDKVLNVITLLLDNGFWVGTFALATDHEHLGCGSDHAWGNAVDISSLGSPGTGWVALNSNSKTANELTIQAMQLLRSQKQGVLKPKQMICNGNGTTNKMIQSLQLNNYATQGGWWVDDHLNHIHVGFGHDAS